MLRECNISEEDLQWDDIWDRSELLQQEIRKLEEIAYDSMLYASPVCFIIEILYDYCSFKANSQGHVREQSGLKSQCES